MQNAIYCWCPVLSQSTTLVSPPVGSGCAHTSFPADRVWRPVPLPEPGTARAPQKN